LIGNLTRIAQYLTRMTMTKPEPKTAPAPPVIYLVRHGETDWSLSGQHTSRTDLPLTPNGVQEARKLAGRLNNIPFTRVFSSPRLRACETCELAGLGGAIEIEPELAEWDYGDYEGLRAPEIRLTRPDWNIYMDGCPNGESPVQMSDRADRLIARLRKLEGNIALFSHGHFSRIFTVRWIGLPLANARHLVINTASLSILSHDQSGNTPAIALWNSVGENLLQP
jgi:broad specificity phosphatase PhoE